MSNTNEIYKYYNQSHLSEVSRKGYYDEKLQFYLSELRNLSSKKLSLLDIACNDGELTSNYTQFGQVLGIDINKEAVALSKKRGIPCLQADIADIKDKYKNTFDVVIAGDIIEHVFDTDQFLRNIHTVLKKNGTLLLTTANVASFGRRIMLLLGKNPFLEYSSELPSIEFNVGHIRYYTIANMRQQLDHTGYNEVKLMGDKINILPFVSIPHRIARNFPTWSRNMFVVARKK